MADGYNVSLDDTLVAQRIAEIAQRLGNLSPAMMAIGETLTESTKRRFDTSTAPDGSRWAPNAQATIEASVGRVKGAYRKDGKLSKKGTQAAMAKRPLVDSGLLQDSFAWQLVDGGQGVEVGTNRFAGEWDGGAAVFHFGRHDGSIPAREIVGMSPADEVEVMDIIDRFCQQAIE